MSDFSHVKEQVISLIQSYTEVLQQKLEQRRIEMQADDTSHYLIYHLLGIAQEECYNIDYYQNAGRFLYRYAGEFLERATIICLQYRYPEGEKVYIPNPEGNRPRTFEIDFLGEGNAFEIKWRDATTDGDHIAKECARAKAIRGAGYTPIRIMYYYPQRTAARRAQEAIEYMYRGLEGAYYYGEAAWSFVRQHTGIDLKDILTKHLENR